MATILVRATPDTFVFATKESIVTVAPVVWYNSTGQIGAFGLEDDHPAHLRRLDLFPRPRPYGYVEPFFQPLRHFLLYHFFLVTYPADAPWWRSLVGFRPHVRYEAVDGFDEAMDGDPRVLLERASRAADARRVDFDATPTGPRRDRAG